LFLVLVVQTGFCAWEASILPLGCVPNLIFLIC
jgi:hypothetical protein